MARIGYLCDKGQSSSIEANRTIFVDSKFGDDESGQAFSANEPVRTIARAIEIVLEKRGQDEEEEWLIRVRPGEYPFNGIVPKSVTIYGSGLPTRIIGMVTVHFNCQLINFNLVGTTLPCVRVEFLSGQINPVGLFFGLDITLSEILNQNGNSTNFAFTRTVIETSSFAFNSTVLFKDCRFFFDLGKVAVGENKFIRTLAGRTEFFTNVINVVGHQSVRNTVLEIVGGVCDVDFGTTIFQCPTNQLEEYVAFYASSSPIPVSIKSNRHIFQPQFVFWEMKVSPEPSPPTDNNTVQTIEDIPAGSIIAYLVHPTGHIDSRNCVNNWRGGIPEREYMAYVLAETAIASVLNFISLGDNVSNIGGVIVTNRPPVPVTNTFSSNSNGSEAITLQQSVVEDRNSNVNYLVQNTGRTYQSATQITTPTVLDSFLFTIYNVRVGEETIIVQPGATNLIQINLFSLDDVQESSGNVPVGWSVTITNNTNRTINVVGEGLGFGVLAGGTNVYRLLGALWYVTEQQFPQ